MHPSIITGLWNASEALRRAHSFGTEDQKKLIKPAIDRVSIVSESISRQVRPSPALFVDEFGDRSSIVTDAIAVDGDAECVGDFVGPLGARLWHQHAHDATHGPQMLQWNPSIRVTTKSLETDLAAVATKIRDCGVALPKHKLNMVLSRVEAILAFSRTIAIAKRNVDAIISDSYLLAMKTTESSRVGSNKAKELREPDQATMKAKLQLAQRSHQRADSFVAVFTERAYVSRETLYQPRGFTPESNAAFALENRAFSMLVSDLETKTSTAAILRGDVHTQMFTI
jgi:hypothetical protein